MKQAMRDMSDKAFKSVCMWTVVISPDFLSPSPSTTSATLENTDDPDDSELADEGDILWLLAQPKYMSSTKISCKNLGQYRYHLIIQNIQYFRICLVTCRSD